MIAVVKIVRKLDSTKNLIDTSGEDSSMTLKVAVGASSMFVMIAGKKLRKQSERTVSRDDATVTSY